MNSKADLPTMKILFVVMLYLLMIVSIGVMAGLMST
ncbi:hypothetical protein J2746_000002 [Methanolobus bombayensis]|nr:hypothetical protein [Methanolobus bombayensis]